MYIRCFFLTTCYILTFTNSYQFEFNSNSDSFLRNNLLNLLCSTDAREFLIYYEQNIDLMFLDGFIEQCSYRMEPIRSIGVVPIM